MTNDSETVTAAPDASSRLTGMRTPLAILAVLLTAVLVGAYWYRASGRESTDDAQVEGHITPVGARVGGSVAEVLVRDNQVVTAGDILVRIDPRDYEIAVARAKAELADANAALTGAQSGVPIVEVTSSSDVLRAAGTTEAATASRAVAERDIEAAKARLGAAEAGIAEAQATADKARKDRDRLNDLVAKEEISQQQFDTAVAAATVAEAGVDSARAAAEEARSGIRGAESKLQQSQAGVRQAEAAQRSTRTGSSQVRSAQARRDAAIAGVAQAQAHVAQAELNLAYTVVKAPAAGIVSRKSVEPGQILQPGQPLLALVGIEDVWVVANFKETQLASIRVGQRVIVDVDAFGHEVDGTVDSIAPATGSKFSLLPAENASGNFVKVVQRVPVKIALTNTRDPERQLRPGMSVEPTIYTR